LLIALIVFIQVSLKLLEIPVSDQYLEHFSGFRASGLQGFNTTGD